MNPLTSPWNNPKAKVIADQQLRWRWAAIKKYLTTSPVYNDMNGILTVNGKFYLAKNSSKMRLKSHLDWVWYTPKTLAQAIDSDTVESYYEIMLNDIRTDPNVWKDIDFEMELKSHYAARAGRASLLDE